MNEEINPQKKYRSTRNAHAAFNDAMKDMSQSNVGPNRYATIPPNKIPKIEQDSDAENDSQ